MQRKLENLRRSEEEEIKESGLHLDWDEIARKGKMSGEEKLIGKWYGIYGSRQEGAHMARVVVPGGQVTSRQARALANIAERHAQGLVNVTTRQSLQLHWLSIGSMPDVLRELKRGDMSTFHGCGDVTRNVAACPWASVCPHRRIDVLPAAKETARYLTACRDLDNLPRKFKVTFSGCEAACGQPYMNCVGVIAIVRKTADGAEEAGYRVVIGGGMGHTAFVAQELYSFVPPDRIREVCKAIGILFRDHGDRFDRARSRLKYVVDRHGIARCREIVDAALDADRVDRAGIEWAPVEDCGPPVPPRPLTATDPIGTDGGAIQRVLVPKGEVTFRQLRALADLCEGFGDKHLYATNRQNLEIHGVPPARVALLREEIRALGLATEGFDGLRDVVTCVGTKYCPMAVARTHDLFDRLQSVVHQDRFAPIRDKAIVNITGCPNACSPYRIADLGFRGMRIREERGSVDGYEIVVGGTQTSHGRKLGEFKEEDCVRVTVAVLDAFLKLREGGLHEGDETLADNVARLGVAPYEEAVARLGIRYDLAEAPVETSVFTGVGATALDRATVAKDIPCQEACPAKTHVPNYIQQIANGDPEEAYRVNQEDNVFPGVLGRICTRPCEDSCRHNWTGTEGPVQICHLKRAAADRAPAPRPLPAWFPKSGLRVAVVGGGPAGLTAARELRRYGHAVTIFEKERELGGLLSFGIPTFRLPREVVRAEVKAIVDSGVEVHTGVAVDRDRLDALQADFHAVLVTVGAMRPIRLGLAGAPDAVAVSGLDLMRAFNAGGGTPGAVDGAEAIRAPVLVIGGGFTAVDCVRAARRILGSGGGDVTMIYRRNEDFMAASREERHTLAEEGIALETLASPLRARTEDGRLAGVVFQRNLLGPAKDGAKPRLIPVPDSEFELPARTLVYAIGQERTLEILPDGVTHATGHRTSRERLFVAGDFGLGSLDVIHAVADAKAAADEIDEYLTGDRRRDKALSIALAENPLLGTGRVRDMDLVPPPEMPHLAAALRERDAEVELGFGDDEARAAAERCYLCDYKYEIDQDRCIHCDWCIRVAPRDCIHRVSALFRGPVGLVTNRIDAAAPQGGTFIWIDSDECIRCGKCLRACPTGAISVRRTTTIPVPRLDWRFAKTP